MSRVLRLAPRRARSRAMPLALLVAVATVAAVVTPTLTPAQTCSQVVNAGIVRAQGCFSQSGSVYTSTQTTDLNGIQVRATPESRLTINTQTRQVSARTSGGELAPVQVAIPGLTVGSKAIIFRKLDFTAPEPARPPETREVVVGYANPVPPVLAGLSPVGTLDVPIKISQVDEDGATGSVTYQYALPGALTLRGIQATVAVVADLYPNRGAVVDGIEVEASGLTVRDIIGVRNLEFRYSERARLWDGALSIAFPRKPKAGADPEGGTIGGEARIEDGRLRRIGIEFGFPVQIFPQIYVNSAKFALEPNPFVFSGGASFSAGEELPKSLPVIGGNSPVSGSINARIAEPGGLANATKQGVVSLQGQVELWELIPVASGAFYAYFFGPAIAPPRGQLNSISFYAKAGIGLPRFTDNARGNVLFVGGEIRGWWEGSKYNFEGSVRASILGWDVTGAQAIISNRGLAACVKPIWWSPYIGGGYSYRAGFRVLGGFSGCGIGDYRETSRSLRAGRDRWAKRALRAPEDSMVLDLSADEQTLRIEGDDEVPSFDLESRDGERISYRWDGTSPDFGPGRRWVVLGDPSHDTAYVLMRDPEGRWAVTGKSGETKITSAEQAKSVAPPSIEAEVVGEGVRRRVRWRAEGLRRDDSISFYETLGEGGRSRVFKTTKAHGSKPFVPAFGPEAGHELHGIVMRESAPLEDHALDRFEVHPPQPPPPPKRVRADRFGTRVVVRWKRQRAASGYVVVLESEDGELAIPRAVRAKRSELVFRRVPIDREMKVKVYATGRLGFPSGAGTARFRAIPPNRSPGRDVREMLRSAEVLPNGNLDLVVPCGGQGECDVSVAAAQRGEVVATHQVRAIPETWRRIRLQLPKALRSELRDGAVRRFTLRGELEQAERTATHRAVVRLGR